MQKQYEVVVAGGGPAGVAAAIAAARSGARTLIVERAGYFGGMATDGLVPAFCPYTNGEETLVRGIGLEILQRMKEDGYVSPFYDDFKTDRIRGLDWEPVKAEKLKAVLDQMVQESGCDILFHTVVTDAFSEKQQVTAVEIYNKSGKQRISAKYFIDCTGDADLVAMTGAETVYGDEQGQTQAGTLCFSVGNIDMKRFLEYAEEKREDGNLSVASAAAVACGQMPAGEEKLSGIAFPEEGIAVLNFGHIFGVNATDAASVSRAELEGRAGVAEKVTFLRRFVPGMERAVLLATAPHVGLRESRRIVGEYCLTKEDYDARRDFPDAIAYYSYPIDMHASAQAGEGELLENPIERYKTTKYKNGEKYGIPYRALLPKHLDNVLVAGKTISADRAMTASVRVMPACFATGQAAGTAAARLAVEQRTTGQARSCRELQIHFSNIIF